MAVTRASAAARKTTLSTSKTTQKGKNSRVITQKKKNDKQKKHGNSNISCSTSSVKRNKSPGIRLIGGRIYDSENGKTCHQCRQKTMDFSVSCKNIADKKQCTFHYCHMCLLNRYGEKAEEAAALGCKWKCPCCRGVCNCSKCMKQRGYRPTGILLPAAKANGFSSVLDMLHLEEIRKAEKDEGASSKKRKASNEEPAASSKRGRRKSSLDVKANSMYLHRSLKTKGVVNGSMTYKTSKTRKVDGKDSFAKGKTKGNVTVEMRTTRSTTILRDFPTRQEEVNVRANGNLKPHEKIARKLRNALDNESEESVNVNVSSTTEKKVGKHQFTGKSLVDIDIKVPNVDVPLPQGINLTKVANLDFPTEDVGHALQFLEFCEVFGEVLDLKKGQSYFLLQELNYYQNTRRRCDFSLERLHIKLLAMIQKDSVNGCSILKARGRNSWLEALVKHISGCPYIPKELILNCSHLSREGYEKLESSKKLRILNFLCDEALGTPVLRVWMDEKNLEFLQERKKAKKMLLPQEKSAGMKLKDEVAKDILLRNGAPFSISEHQNLVSKIKAEVSKSLEGMPCSDVIRLDPILSDVYGRKFWKLKSYNDEVDVLLQDIACRDHITSGEKWFAYDLHERENIERYISSVKEA